jgi:hypothetical protein
MYKAQLATIEGWATKDKVLSPKLKLVLYPLYSTKPNKLCLARLVGNVDYKALISTLAKEVFTRHTTANLDIATLGICLIQLADIVDLCAVNIAKRKVVEHIAHRVHPNLPSEQLGTHISHT